MTIEGPYRLVSHNEKGEAIYAQLAPEGAVEWVRAWREATTFLLREHAERALQDTRARDPKREVRIAQRFQDRRRSGWAKKRTPEGADA